MVLLAVSLVTSTLTSRAKQRDQLKSENEREKIRTDLLRSISHDIRTPLTSIIGTTQTLLQMPQIDEQESRVMLSDVNKEAQWLLRMTEKLLSVTKIEDNSNLVVLTYDYIMKKLWGPRAGKNNQILRVNMANIRRKIEDNPARPEYLFTEVDVGYRLAGE